MVTPAGREQGAPGMVSIRFSRSMPPAEDWAETLREHLGRAGVTRAAPFEDSETVKHITFYDLRATGITWRTCAATTLA